MSWNSILLKKARIVQGQRDAHSVAGSLQTAAMGSGVGMVDVEICWSIEGPLDILRDATKAAGIDSNAINPGSIDADLTYPSFFCASRAAWIKALAYLFVRNIQFRLFIVGSTEADGERWRYQVLPAMDAEMLALMKEIDAAEALEIEALSDHVERVASRLRAVEWEEDGLIQ